MESTTSLAEYFPIDLAYLSPDSVPGFDLYIARSPGKEPSLYRQRNLVFTAEVLERLRENNVGALYIPEDQERDYYRYMEQNLRRMLRDDSIGVEEKAHILYGATFNAVRDFFDDPSAEDLLPRASNLARSVVGFLQREREAFRYLVGELAFDYEVYTHSTNVSIYSLSLASVTGHGDPELLARLGTGTLLHDLGKTRISDDILKKKGPLTDEEFAVIKKHPEWGLEILEEHGITDEVVLAVTLNHHEKLNGRGYPNGLEADDLEPFVRITTICDIFDALTTKRSYKDAMKSFDAFKLMKDEMQGQLDDGLFQAMVQMMAAQRTLQ